MDLSREFQLLSSGFIPDPFGSEGLRMTSLLLGGVVALLLFSMSLRERANKVHYGAATEPLAFLIGKNVVFAAAIVASVICWRRTRACPTFW